MTHVLDIDGLTKTFGGLTATDNVSLNVRAGEIHALIGPNGAGKSTLINQICGEILPNAWLGTSIEDAEVASRVDHLRQVPAAIRFISFEPLIGSVGAMDLSGIDWAIVGGESGRSARPIREEWIDEIHTQCLTAGTAFFFKQWGTWGKDNKKRSKKANGREYRGRTWDEMPNAASGLAAL